MTEWAGEDMITAGDVAVGPAEPVSDDMVMPAHGSEIGGAGDPGFSPWDAVVEVALG